MNVRYWLCIQKYIGLINYILFEVKKKSCFLLGKEIKMLHKKLLRGSIGIQKKKIKSKDSLNKYCCVKPP